MIAEGDERLPEQLFERKASTRARCRMTFLFGDRAWRAFVFTRRLFALRDSLRCGTACVVGQLVLWGQLAVPGLAACSTVPYLGASPENATLPESKSLGPRDPTDKTGATEG